jgi:hypothetical protein
VPDADNPQRRAGQLGNGAHVTPRRRRQVRKLLRGLRRIFPTGKLTVNRLAILQLRGVAWRHIEALAIQSVGYADLDALNAVQTIEVRHGQLVDAVYHRRVTRRHRIEPAAAPGPSGGRAKLATHLVQLVRDAFVFCREGTFADSRRISLHHADNAIHLVRRNSGAGAGAARGRVGRSHERIRAVIDVEKRSLRAFKQDLLFVLQGAVQIDHRVRDERPQGPAGLEIKVVHLAEIDRLRPECLEDAVVLADLGLQFFREQRRLHQVRHAQSSSGRLVTVGGTDPALGRPDLRVAFAQLALFVEHPVIRQDEVRAIADEEVLPDFDTKLAQPLNLFYERNRIDHNAVADYAAFAATQNPRRNQVKNIFRAAMNDGVAGVVPALAPDHDVGLGGQDVDDLAFAFVAPLRADQNGVGHDNKTTNCPDASGWTHSGLRERIG